MARLFAVICAACFFVSAHAQGSRFLDQRRFANKLELEDLTFAEEGMQDCRILSPKLSFFFHQGNMNTNRMTAGTTTLHIRNGAVQVCMHTL